MLRLVLYCLLLSVAGNTLVSAQVYNYTPFIYNDSETNPTVIVTDKYKNNFSILHANSFSPNNPLSVSRFTVQKKTDNKIFGTALTISNTNWQKKTYNHLALGLAYRNILFNKIYLRLGVTGKLIQNNAGPGYFDLFSFRADEHSQFSKINSNFNYNVALVSGLERYSISYSYLNHNPFIKSDSLLFPQYHLIHIGNLASIFEGGNWSNSFITFTLFTKKRNVGPTQYNFYTNVFYYFPLNRRTTLLIGGRAGYSTAGYYHFLPSLSFQKENLLLSLSYSFYSPKNISTNLISTYQIQLNFNLWSKKYARRVYF